MRVMQITAPAKINLNLRVLGPLAGSGFHGIRTLMAPVSLGDRLQLELVPEPGIRLTCSDPSLPTGPGNLAFDAARLLLDHLGTGQGLTIRLEKRIPHGAGLGGGSSDAAAVLKALNILLDAGLAAGELENLAATLGSDVPFFIRGVPAVATGRGEILEPHHLPELPPVLLVKPPFGIETAWAYRQWSRTNHPPRGSTERQELAGIELVNDLEAPAFAKHLVLPALKQWLRGRPEVSAALMSGSGSTIFAFLQDPCGLRSLVPELRTTFGPTFHTEVAHALHESPAPGS